ncbi:hypothetical protein HDU96_006427 [Phlyctochytrium bullatum]|nr:hypothetical protein HDU96_006427 [Phlyctochytrium bullatum]
MHMDTHPPRLATLIASLLLLSALPTPTAAGAPEPTDLKLPTPTLLPSPPPSPPSIPPPPPLSATHVAPPSATATATHPSPPLATTRSYLGHGCPNTPGLARCLAPPTPFTQLPRACRDLWRTVYRPRAIEALEAARKGGAEVLVVAAPGCACEAVRREVGCLRSVCGGEVETRVVCVEEEEGGGGGGNLKGRGVRSAAAGRRAWGWEGVAVAVVAAAGFAV